MKRRNFTLASVSAATLGALAPFSAQAQVPETARIIVGFPPGGVTDAFARRIAEKLRGTLANVVVVDNKPGAGGQVGVLTLKDAATDGTVLLLTPASMLTVYPHSYSKLGYKVDDVAPVTVAMATVHGFGVGPAVPESVKNVRDFVTWAKANPDKASVGNPGAGSMPHLLAGMLAKLSGANLNNIPFPGSGPGIQQLLGGQIAAMSSPLGDYLVHAKAGKLRILATSGGSRSQFAPDVPTYKEQGFDLEVREWFGFFVPGKASTQVRERVSTALRAALSQPDVAASVAQFGLEVQPTTPDEHAALLKRDSEIAGRLVQALGFKADS